MVKGGGIKRVWNLGVYVLSCLKIGFCCGGQEYVGREAE